MGTLPEYAAVTWMHILALTLWILKEARLVSLIHGLIWLRMMITMQLYSCLATNDEISKVNLRKSMNVFFFITVTLQQSEGVCFR